MALRNIHRLCSVIAPLLIDIDTYRNEAELIVMGQVILFKEGTTPGGPLAMAMYAFAIVSLVKSITTAGASQVWFADDA